MQDTAVLVLNQNYEPINICNARRALVLVFYGKAEVLEDNHAILHTSRAAYRCPSVIRLVHLIRRPWPKARLTRREIFLRDGYTCQYCGIKTRELTLDHVVPRHRGGQHTWENLVSACHACNHRKGGRTPAEAHMQLLHVPVRPKSTGMLLFYDYAQTYQEWGKFLPEPEEVAN
jgi:5-methylcytosine-specific restriction endonuclease McrA